MQTGALDSQGPFRALVDGAISLAFGERGAFSWASALACEWHWRWSTCYVCSGLLALRHFSVSGCCLPSPMRAHADTGRLIRTVCAGRCGRGQSLTYPLWDDCWDLIPLSFKSEISFWVLEEVQRSSLGCKPFKPVLSCCFSLEAIIYWCAHRSYCLFLTVILDRT